MKKRGLRKRVSVRQDPNYPVKRRTVTTTLTLPGADAETVAAFQVAAIELNVDKQIKAARRRLPQIAGLPEHAAASLSLRRAAAYWRNAQNPSLPLAQRDIAAGDGKGSGALGALDRFNEAISKGLLRKVIAPRLERDDARQAATRGLRGSRMPELDAWLDNELRANPTKTDKALWKALPTDDDLAKIYRDGDNVVETNHQGAEHKSGSAGFAKRVTAARQRINAVNN